MSWISLSPDNFKQLEKMYMKKKTYIQASMEYSGYKVIMRIDKKRLIEDYQHEIVMSKLLKSKPKSIKSLIQLQLIIELKSIIGSQDKCKLISFGG